MSSSGPRSPVPVRQAWYQTTTGIVVSLLVVGPLALPLVWINRRWSIGLKFLVSVVTVVLTVLCWKASEQLLGIFQSRWDEIKVLYGF